MAQNVFDATFDTNNRIDVNSFDWSHVNNLTTDFGRITPVFCELVPAKGSLRINPEFGLELMPMVFPVQTRMFARLNFFKVTLRSMWEDYSDFISNFRDDLEEPYILPDYPRFQKMCKTGTLGDYLGLPTFGTNASNTVTLSDRPCSPDSRYFSESSIDTVMNDIRNDRVPGISCSTHFNYDNKGVVIFDSNFTTTPIPAGTTQVGINVALVGGSADAFIGAHGFIVHLLGDGTYNTDYPVTITKSKDGVVGAIISSVDVGDFSGVQGGLKLVLAGMTTAAPIDFKGMHFNAALDYYQLQKDVSYPKYPFATEGSPERPRLLAYRFRAYEAVYNAYYRDIRNNPFVVDGRPVYNKWLSTMKGGADKTSYELHQCNWERDFLTTAVPNPQQGANAPLVGLVMGDVITRSEDGTLSVQKQTVLVDEDGSKYGVSYKVSEDGERLVGVDYDPVSEKTPVTAN